MRNNVVNPNASMAPLRIAFFYDLPPGQMPSFVQTDLIALEEIGHVRWAATGRYPAWHPIWKPRLGLRRVAHWLPTPDVRAAIEWCDVGVQWFASCPGPGLAARAAGKPLLVIAGGYDVTYAPDVGYGLMSAGRQMRWMAQMTLRLAHKVLALSRSTLADVRRWAPRAAADYLYLGVDPAVFFPHGARRTQVTTVSRIAGDWIRKGLRDFVLAARELPEVPFVLVGPEYSAEAAQRLRELAPANVTFTGAVPHSEIPGHLQRSAVYAQLSYTESFCLALAEAMRCGCTAVVTRRGALPEVAGPCAHYVEPGDPRAAAAALRVALSDEERGRHGAARIAELFPISARRAGLQEEVRRLARRTGWIRRVIRRGSRAMEGLS